MRTTQRESLFLAAAVAAGLGSALVDLSSLLSIPLLYYVGLNMLILIIGGIALERTGSVLFSVSVIFFAESFWNLFWLIGALASGHHIGPTLNEGAGYVVPVSQYYAGLAVQFIIAAAAYFICSRKRSRKLNKAERVNVAGPNFHKNSNER
ncbi:MAG: hypothetical protein KIY12_08580 [Thermoplasmata archaeon]|uniref:Uncharacterized protein n=1 Tax=Candidatus Sysuiplasma superficiale TaxID=2823368 RepID=A0A8J7YU74_9ARCH|nr:hypothetical protein [Candidatus Sysuiplasma superficiale]